MDDNTQEGEEEASQVAAQKLSLESVSLDEVSVLLDSQAIWTQFNQTSIDAEREETIAASRLDQATIALAGILLLSTGRGLGR